LNLENRNGSRSIEHARIFGYQELSPDWTYEKFLEHVLPEERTLVNEKIQAAVKNHGGWNFECRIRRIDGEIRWIWAAGHYRTKTLGHSPHMTGIVQDITERKQFQEILQRKERFLNETGHIAKVGGWEFDPATGEGNWTDEVASIHDLDASVKPSKEFGLGFYAPESRPKIEAAVKAASELGTPYDLELEIISAKGIRKWVRTICEPVLENDRVVRVCGAIQDITFQKKSELLLAQQNALLEMIAGDTPLPTILEEIIRTIESQDASLIGSVLLLDHQTKQLRHGAAPSLPERYNRAIDGIEIGEGVGSCGTAAFRGKPVIVANIQTDLLWKNFCALAKEFDLAACWSTPIFSPQREVLGTFAVYQKQPAEPTESQLRLIGMISHLAAVAIHRQQTAATLQEQRQQLDYIINNTKDSIFQIDLRGNYIFGNAAAEQLTGRPLAQLLQMNMMQLVAPEHQAAIAERLRRRIAGEPEHKNIEFEILRHDGSRVWVELTTSSVCDPAGKLTAIQGVARDVTRRKQTEAERANLAAIVQNSQDAIISKTLDGIITSWNLGAEKIFGFTADEALGRPLLIIFPTEKLHEEQQILQRISRGETVEHFETVRVRKDGRQINVSATISPVRDANGKIIGASNISRDTTEKIRLQEQLRQSQKMEAIGQLSAGIAHDFNNLLTAIHGNASLLADATAEERKECAEEILAAANRAAELTRQLLLFSRKQAMRFTAVDLNATVASTGKMLRRLLGENITLHTEHAPALPSIRADAGMIDQVIFNLAVNAHDAMRDLNGTLTIRTSVVKAQNPDDEKSAPQNCVCLTVSDTGHGISPEILPRIFEPFFTTKEVGKGTGLGLATIYGIVKQHGGWVSVESEVGRGTTFKIYFPASVENIHEPPPEIVFNQLPRGTETILVVEDEAPVRKFLGNFLSRLGYKILTAESGIAALELWPRERENISLVLTDIVMPHGLRGYDLADKLLADRPAVKIIFTSGYASDTEPRRAMLVEGVNFIRKPFKPEALAEIIRRNLDGKIS
jgi:two-component system, cell cycle sensor histidine kinase and response regulator CckA